ncbi:MAG: M48 family metallopeptidase [Chloroflexi bacterium]|nr:M48 family metallopeptidase [Chloroflexota bacterium]
MPRKNRPQLTTLGARQITLGGQKVPYTLKRSPRARFARLEIRRDTGLTVVVPRSYPMASLDDFLKAKARWILEKLAKYALAPTSPERPLVNAVPYLGGSLPVEMRQKGGNFTTVALEKNKLVVELSDGHPVLDLVLERWFRWRAGQWIGERVRDLSARLCLACGRITIRAQRSRWASCSRKGNLSFNWRLLMAPESVIDYVIIHELCHLKEMNHQKGFWQLVARFCPRWREHKRWLTDHQAELNSGLSSRWGVSEPR